MSIINNIKKSRLKYALAFILMVLVEIFIALYVQDEFIRPYIGDILVVFVLYCAAKMFLPSGKLLPLWIFIFAVFVEFLQYINIVNVLGLSESIFWKTLVGSVFDWNDIICYGIGCLLLFIYEKALRLRI